MKNNYYNEIQNEIQFFVEKFKQIGWKQEDEGYITKRLPFITNPTARNEEWLYSVGMKLHPKILSYFGDKKTHGQTGVDEIWICCETGIETDDVINKNFWASSRVKEFCTYMKQEIDKIGWKAFYDEDAFSGIFARPKILKNLEMIEIKFFLNKDYSDGYWENHTL